MMVIMGAEATPADLSHPASVAVCRTLGLDRRGVGHAFSAHTTDAKVVWGEQVDIRTWAAPAHGNNSVCTAATLCARQQRCVHDNNTVCRREEV